VDGVSKVFPGWTNRLQFKRYFKSTVLVFGMMREVDLEAIGMDGIYWNCEIEDFAYPHYCFKTTQATFVLES
jgi:hypothetical protein